MTCRAGTRRVFTGVAVNVLNSLRPRGMIRSSVQGEVCVITEGEQQVTGPRGPGQRWAAVVMMVVGSMTIVSAQTTPPPKPAEPKQTPPPVTVTVDVVGATPIVGIGVERDRIPSNIQVITADALTRTGGVSVVEQLSLSAGSASLNEATTNPFQPDLQFRGFTASPLLGLPQGLAVYQDGVRLNEPFGDTVNWDLLPSNAIAGITLMPGSNPLFGLNALGGAVSLQTKNGFTHRGNDLSFMGGSFERYAVEGSSGGGNDRLSYFVAGNAVAEEGWRDHSPSRVRQLFGDVGYRGAKTTVNTSVTYGQNRLIGNGPAPVQLLDEDRSAIFTYPDETKTRMTLVSLRARHARSSALQLDGTLFFRRASVGTFNGDDSNYDECDDDAFDEFLCADDGDGDLVRNQFGGLIPVDDDDELNATNNTSRTVTNGWGGALQLVMMKALSGRPNHFVSGVTFDAGRSRYDADTEIARLTEDRGTAGTGLYDDAAVVRLRTTVRHFGAYVADFLTVAPRTTLMGAARFNYSSVQLRDQIGTELDGDHGFTRLNPAAGITHAFAGGPTAFGSFSMSSRVPAPSELSCADPEDPCRLPNAFVADPPLDQVVANTWEAGVRGTLSKITWNLSAFRTANRDDIMFISSGPLTNTGHFENVGDTLRRGIELGLAGESANVRWTAAYTFLRAQFDTPLTLSSPNHPDEDDGEIPVEAGDRIPGMPLHNLKGSLEARVRRLALGLGMVAGSSHYLRGDEGNLLDPQEGFAMMNLTASYKVHRQVRIKGRVSNLFGSTYATFGLLGEADEVLGDAYDDPRFLSPGAPRAAWIGIEFSIR